MKNNIYLHIGTLKTGSTSIQYFLKDHKDMLGEFGFSLYSGFHNPINHLELFLASMRYKRDSFAKIKMKKTSFDKGYTKEIVSFVQDYLGSCKEKSQIFTTEGLSLIRFEDEINRLKKILNAGKNRVKVIVYLRDRESFLESYKKQIKKIPGREFSTNPESSLYVEPDTWLLDYDRLIEVYENGFGKENVSVIDYDREVAIHSTVIPSFLEKLGLPVSQFSRCSEYRFNKSS